jgi:hypothetical protein
MSVASSSASTTGAHEGVGIDLLLQHHSVQKAFLVHILVDVPAHHHGLDHRKPRDRRLDASGIGAHGLGVDHVQHDVVAVQAFGIVDAGVELLEPVGGLRADIEISSRA